MGWLAAQGAIMAIGLFIGLVCSVIGLFFGHIILFDSIALGIAAGVCCNQFTAIHPALCLVIGIATLACNSVIYSNVMVPLEVSISSCPVPYSAGVSEPTSW